MKTGRQQGILRIRRDGCVYRFILYRHAIQVSSDSGHLEYFNREDRMIEPCVLGIWDMDSIDDLISDYLHKSVGALS